MEPSVLHASAARRRRRAERRPSGKPASRSAPGRESRPEGEPRGRLQGLLVLIVEDHADSREMLRQMVESLGARTLLAENGREALRVLATQGPDVILCDLLMPEMDGFVFIRELRGRAEWRAIPILAVTALGSDTDYRRTWEAGFDGHLTKPIQPAQLEAVIEAVVRRRCPRPQT